MTLPLYFLNLTKVHLAFAFLMLLNLSCNNSDQGIKSIEDESLAMFTKINSSHSKIKFRNQVKESFRFNSFYYMYVYNGGGVSAGDINNDGLIDLYFSSNQNENKLYLNKGNFVFEDITSKAGVSDKMGWSTGTTMADVNGDGWLDIYVCKSASLESNAQRRNKLYINQKDNTFIEEASKWRMDDSGFSVQSYFFDMDKDGDLDFYLVNHRVDFKNNGTLNPDFQMLVENETSDQLYRNDGTHFTNITPKSGIMNKAWGLSAAIGDFNNDSWPDIYVCNDYLEPDYLYINQQNNTFKDSILTTMQHISFNSMGSDFADINNDGFNDLVVLDMTPSDHVRSKTNMASMSTENFQSVVDVGYHHQYMVNMLQLNNANGTFSEIGQLAKVAKSDWSWAPLLADFDNDGYRDLFVSNGIFKDLGNRDFRNEVVERSLTGQKLTLDSVLKLMPTEKLSNRMYHNKGNYTFKNVATEWGVDQVSFSNGATYADLDNDGDLDLICNNIEDEAFIYKNNAANNFLQITLKASGHNPLAIGAKINLYHTKGVQTKEHYVSRGFQSSVHNRINFGLGDLTSIDSLIVIWPDGRVSLVDEPAVNSFLTIDDKDVRTRTVNGFVKSELPIETINAELLDVDFKHQENKFDDYKNQILLPHSQSRHGPFMDKGDVNNDGLDDFYIGGAAGQSGSLFLQNSAGKFSRLDRTFQNDKAFEDLGVLFFDFDNDQDLDLYVVSGGSEFPVGSSMFQDRIYENDGEGNFSKTKTVLPEIRQSGQVVIHADVDNDGDQDIFIGGRIIPDKYPYAPESFLLMNNKGKLSKVKLDQEGMGMVSDAVFSDYDNDGDPDLMIVGEWSEILLLKNVNGKFLREEISGLKNSRGLWQSIVAKDMDGDGDEDYLVGNIGRNVKFDTENKKEFHVFCDDFDGNGTYDVMLSNKYKGDLVPVRGRECSSEQLPEIEKKFPSYFDFANATVEEILGQEKLNSALHYRADLLHHVYIENRGGGSFIMSQLPMETQIAPILDWTFSDIDKDGIHEILSVGNNYNTEVETIRLDASYGNVLKYEDGSFKVLHSTSTGFSVKGDARNIQIVNDKWILVSVNDGAVQCFQVK